MYSKSDIYTALELNAQQYLVAKNIIQLIELTRMNMICDRFNTSKLRTNSLSCGAKYV